jgi:C-terminal processing protease CtpA/Prc
MPHTQSQALGATNIEGPLQRRQAEHRAREDEQAEWLAILASNHRSLVESQRTTASLTRERDGLIFDLRENKGVSLTDIANALGWNLPETNRAYNRGKKNKERP